MRLRELHIAYRPLERTSRLVRGCGWPHRRQRPICYDRCLNTSVEVLGPLLLLNTKHEPLAWHVLSRGTLDATLVHPREAIKAACLANAAAVVNGAQPSVR